MLQNMALTSDFNGSVGDPLPALESIARAGFSSVHWCHHWNTDFVYMPPEVAAIKRRLGELGLSVNDLHASYGQEKGWCSALPYQRLAGVALVINRLEMAAELECPVAILHLPELAAGKAEIPPDELAARWSRLRQSLDALQPQSRRLGVRIALENTPGDNWAALEQVLAEYPPDFVGLCYDAGHGTISGNGLERLQLNKSRLIALHLHDSDGVGDFHWLPFEGRTDWPRLAAIIAESGYQRQIMTMESNMKCPPHKGTDPEAWLALAAESGRRLATLISQARGG